MEKNRKILIFSTAYYPFVGGAEVAIKAITDRISDFQFDLITAKLKRGLPKIEKIGNVNVYRIGFGYKFFDKIWLALFGAGIAQKLHKEKKYDITWSMMASQASIAAANFKIRNPEVKLMLTLQEGDEEEHLKRYVFGIDFLYRLFIRPWHLLVFRDADSGTAISNYLVERMRKNGMKVPIKLIPNGVDVKNFQFSFSNFQERQKVRGEIGINEEDIALVTASRLVTKNGVGDVIKALPKLDKNIKFIILGEGELRKSLQELAKNLRVSDRVIFKGFVPHQRMPKYLKACDIFIRPSLSEGMGNSFVEAMACQIPVIGTPVGGIVDFLVDPAKLDLKEMRSGMEVQTGYFCQPQNPESIAESVRKVLSDPNRNQIIENAYNMVLEKYDWNKIAEDMKKVFDVINIYEK